MKASTVVVVVLAAVIVIAAASWSVITNSHRIFVTKTGQTISAHDASFGGPHRTRPLEVPFSKKLQDAVRSRSLQPLRQRGWESGSGGYSGLTLWVSEREIPNLGDKISRIRILAIRLPDGQVLVGRHGGSGARFQTGGIWELGSFPIIPWREKVLNVEFDLDGEQAHLRFPNPAYKSDLPNWQADPLPQTWKHDGLCATLTSLELIWNKGLTDKGIGWELRQRWSVTFNEQPANEWLSVRGSVEDAGGNRSPFGGLMGEPAWKLHCSVSRTYAFPFPDDEVKWFGWIDAKTYLTMEPGHCVLLDVDDVSRSWGILFAGLFAPGDYEIENGKVVSQSPPTAGKHTSSVKSFIDPETKRLKISVSSTSFLRHVRSKLQTGWTEVWLDENGKSAYLGGQGIQIDGATLWEQHLLSGLEKSFKYGIAKRGETQTFELMVHPPAVPGGGIPVDEKTLPK